MLSFVLFLCVIIIEIHAAQNSYKFDKWSKCYFGAYDVTNHVEQKRCDDIIMKMRKTLMDMYRKDSFDWKEDFDIGLAKAEADWVNALIYRKKRTKRQAPEVPVIETKPRKEVRMMSEYEWGNFTLAVNLLKYDNIPGSTKNKYDTIAAIIRSNLNATYNGPGFLGFNRAYLELFERALQEMVPGVTVPYWDCSKDYYMDDPRESILWSEIFFGSGNGFVTDGPFGNWTSENEGPLFREIGVHPSSLFSVPGLKAIFARRSHTMITLPQPDLTQRFTIEGQQNGVHAWVGGQMRMREFSAQDPVHFLHRAFVDYIWSKFAENSEVDPGTDYPLKGGAEHSPNASMYYFEQNTNSDGYKLDALYDDTPFCNSTMMDCNSPWLECTYFLGNKVHMCISRRRAFFEIKDNPSTLDKVPTLYGTPYNAVFVDERTGKTP